MKSNQFKLDYLKNADAAAAFDYALDNISEATLMSHYDKNEMFTGEISLAYSLIALNWYIHQKIPVNDAILLMYEKMPFTQNEFEKIKDSLIGKIKKAVDLRLSYRVPNS
jgi:hypothetical protein